VYFSPMYILHACTQRRSSCRLVRVSLSSKPSQSPRRHPEIVPDSASKTPDLPVLTCYESASLPCCPSLPCYLPCLNNAYELCTQTFRRLCIRASMVLFVRVCVQQSHYRHRCGEWRTKSWRISTSRIARSDQQRSRW
jgi:hypothetical protein